MVALAISFVLMALVSGVLIGGTRDTDLPDYARAALGFAFLLQVIAEALVVASLLAAG